jgi:putative ABC transport system permease protein
METLWQDLRYGLRMLAKNPGFTAIAVLTLGLGIGANTAIFSVINTVLLSPLPYKDSGQLAAITATDRKTHTTGVSVSYPKFTLLNDQTQALESVGAYFSLGVNLTGRGEPEQLTAALVSKDFFHVLGVSPAHGRNFLPQEDQPGGGDVAIITDNFWQSHFGGDPKLLGSPIELDGKSVTIIGILPASFQFPIQQPPPDIWKPRVFDLNLLRPDQIQRGAGYLYIIGRMQPGVTVARAQSELQSIDRRYQKAFPGNADGLKYDLAATSLENNLVGTLRPSLFVLLAAVGLVLLIACANVASLLMARATSREKEIAIRRALGASRGRLIRQLLTESFLLSFAGGGLGFLVTVWVMPLLRAFNPGTVPRLQEIHVDGTVLFFSLTLCFFTGLAFGLAPSLQFSWRDMHERLKEGGRGSSEGGKGGRLRELLVIAEIAVALILVTGAGLLIQSFVRMMRVNPGFDSQSVMTFPIALPPNRYSQPEKSAEFYRQLIERMQSLPGVQSAGVTSFLPLGAGLRYVYFCPENLICQGIGRDPLIVYRQASPDFFRTMHIPLLQGRKFSPQDRIGSSPAVIINQSTANQYFPGQNPIGKHLHISSDLIEREIIGVVGDLKFSALTAPNFPEMYLPLEQVPWPITTLVVRSNSNSKPLIAAVRQKISEIDPDLPIAGIQSMNDIVASSVAQPKLLTQLVGVFATFALLLAAIGIYGVMAYSVARRTQELGIRVALGAQPADILRIVLGQGMRLVLIGLGLGVAVSLGLTRLLSSLLFGVSTTDPWTFGGVALALVTVAMLASYIPARRAMRVDPIVALRYE